MDLGLAGKTALITAASRGLGRAVAHRLALEGANVAICARGSEALVQTASEIRAQTGSDVLAVTADVTQRDQITQFVYETHDTFGRLDIVVANAGGPPPGGFLEVDPDAWNSAIDLTLMSVVTLCREAAPILREQRAGAILAIASMSVKQPLPRLVLSNSLRLAVVGLVKSLADELAADHIRVNAICPGWTATERVTQLLSDRAARSGTTPEHEAQSIIADIPLGRMGTPEEFANAAAFLVSPAASFITGVSLLVDGGAYRGTM
ncbi:MAG: SDR family oxidoreductase [Chloroflexi bacterium]|nr:SDR family oxidoreductase [Chloroflexota bacterium]